MRKFLASMVMSLIGLGSSVTADQSVVVVELYTSQGCSSCPPADALLAEMAQRDGVIALSLHVDYWDYLGWRDDLARPEFTERQAKFNTKMKSRYRLVTPQMIFNGQDYVAGAKREDALMYLDKMSKTPESAKMSVSRDGGVLSIVVNAAAGDVAPSDVHVIQYEPSTLIEIQRGENAGRTIDYVNTVVSWETIGQWDGKSDLAMQHSVDASANYAVIVQSQNLGPILVARQLD